MPATLAVVRWPILERIPLVGDFAISPHGISIAAGFFLGAVVLTRRAQLRGVAYRSVHGIPEQMQSLTLWAALGALAGARFFYVVTRLDEFPTVWSWFTIWEGGISLLGGIAGGVAAGVPFAWRRRYSIRLLFDSIAPALALGIFVGRIGDLVIGEHLGGRTDFFLGWRCSGAVGDPAAPRPWIGPQAQGCFDAVVHQTALYDLMTAGIVLGVLLLLERRPRFDGFFLVGFTVLYGVGRFLTDFARAADIDMVGTLTGSQLSALSAALVALAWVAITRPDRHKPWAWSPPDFRHPWSDPSPSAEGRSEPALQKRAG